MTATSAVFAFSISAALLTITPGLDTALVLRTAIAEGRRSAFMAGIGICLGCLLWGVMASAGLGMVLTASRVAYRTCSLLGAAYLLYLGGRLVLRPTAGTPVLTPSEARSTRTAADRQSPWLIRGLLTNLLNPKVGVFYVALLPQFVPTGARVVPFSLLLTTIHAAEGLLWFGALSAAAQRLAPVLRRSRVIATLDRATGLLLVGIGLRIAFASRDR